MVLRAPRLWTEYIHIRRTRGEAGRPFYGKIKGDEIVQSLGFRIPQTLKVLSDPSELVESTVPDSFVLKPSDMTNSRGVMVLIKKEGGFFDLMAKRHFTLDEIKEEQRRLYELWKIKKHRKSGQRFILQERVIGENGNDQIPFDYKFYTFNGEIRLVLQIDRNTTPNSIYFFRNEFEGSAFPDDIETTWQRAQRATPVVPRCQRELVHAAQEISKALRTPFVRVDLFATAEGPVVGELTPAPGAPYYGRSYRMTPKFDAELGALWTENIRKLGLEMPIYDEATAKKRRVMRKGRPGVRVAKARRSAKLARSGT